MWNWKNLKGLNHNRRHRKFSCHFFLHVHAIQGLPSSFNGQRLRINWERNGRVLQTRPVIVTHGNANFEETLSYKCSVHANQDQNHHTISYESKFFKIYLSTLGDPEHDTGIYWIDVSRFLPLTVEELEEKGSGKCTESINLTGNAKGAMVTVSHVFAFMGRHHSSDRSVKMIVFNLLNDQNLNQMDHSSDLFCLNCGTSSGMISEVGSVSSASDDFGMEIFTPLEPTLVRLTECTHDEIEGLCDCEEITIIDRGVEFPVMKQPEVVIDNPGHVGDTSSSIFEEARFITEPEDDDDVNEYVLQEFLDAAENEEKIMKIQVYEEDEEELDLEQQRNSIDVKMILQASIPVVLPIAMGSSIMEILEHWASVGEEQMFMQLDVLMPLDDFNRKKMEEAERTPGDEVNSDFVSIENIVPLAMEKIEALSIEGLKIQLGKSDEEAPSIIRPQLIGGQPTFVNKEEDSEDEPNTQTNDVNGLIELSITLDEWMKLDSGNFGDEDVDVQTYMIIAAHQDEDASFDGENGGILGNNFTVAIRVKLRDPHHEFETVGAPMAALIQIERAPRVSNTNISDAQNYKLFKIIEVHVVGFDHIQSRVWSISAHVFGPGAHWKKAATQTPHIRNPDVAFLT